MKKNRRKILLMLFTFFVCFVMMGDVMAAVKESPASDSVYIKRSKTGSSNQIKTSPTSLWNGSMTYKAWGTSSSNVTLSKRNAWCTTFHHPSDEGFKNGNYTTAKCGNWFNSITGDDFVIAGQIVKAIRSGESNANNRYIYTVLTLNTFFKQKKITGAVDFTKDRNVHEASSTARKKINDYISKAKTEATKIKNFSITKHSFSPSSGTMSKYTVGGNTYYMSGKITLSNLDSGLNVASDTSVAVTPSGASVSFCTNANGTGTCVAKPTGNGSYYVKVSGVTSGNVSVTLNARKSLSYEKGIIVCLGNKTNQAMLITKNFSKSDPASAPLSLKIPAPDVKEVEVVKVDESGNKVDGAEFTLSVKDTQNNTTNISLAKRDGDNATFYGTNIPTDFSFLNKTIILTETKTPLGYKKSEIAPLQIPNKSGTFCINQNDANDTNSQICNAVPVCEITKKTVDISTYTDGRDPSTETTSEQVVEHRFENYPSEGDCGQFAETVPDVEERIPVDESQEQVGTKVTKTTVTSEKKCYINGDTSNSSNLVNCDDLDNYYKVTVNANSVFLTATNVLNSITISKKGMTGEDEVPGASLRVCEASSFNASGGNNYKCEAAKTVGNTPMEWVSSDTPREFDGVKPGSYVVIETLPPSGYKVVNTATQFTVNEDGDIVVGDKKSDNNTIVINNALNEMTISKTDIVTTKELPGAKLAICIAVNKNGVSSGSNDDNDDSSESNNNSSEDNGSGADNDDNPVDYVAPTTADSGSSGSDFSSTNPSDYTTITGDDGECIPVTLQDGSGDAVWVSGDKPHPIKGLPSGVYFLVETTAPNGYATSESILFRMNDNGELTDIAGNSLKDNKIVMKDAPLNQVKTGKTGLVIAIVATFVAAAACIYFFAFHNKAVATVSGSQIAEKIRKRRIHK